MFCSLLARQVRVSRFYQSCFLLLLFLLLVLRAPDLSGHCRTSTASSRSQSALPDLNRHQISVPDINYEQQISVGAPGTQPRINHERQISAGIAWPQLRAPDFSGTSTSAAVPSGPLRSGARGWGPAVPMSERMSEYMRDRMPEKMPERMPEWIPERMPDRLAE